MLDYSREYDKIKLEVHHLFHRYGAVDTTDKSYDRMNEIINLCFKEVKEYPGLFDTIDNWEYFIIQIMCDNWKVGN